MNNYLRIPTGLQSIFLSLPIAVIVLLIIPVQLTAQTCSCGGAPLISSQSLTTVSEGNLVVGLTMEYNDISNLYTGTEELQDRNQQRTSTTALFEVNYGITDYLTLSSTFSFINKSRTSGLLNPSGSETLETSGFGDGLVLLKYNLLNQSLWNPFQLSVGAGTKIPFGTTSLTNNGLALNADMQPGTGAWDGIGWLYISRVLRETNVNVYLNSSYRFTGTNERFNESDNYKFGNEFVTSLGAAGGIWGRLSYNAVMKYRHTTSDERNGTDLPNTGGEWLSLRPGIGYQLFDRLNVQLNAEIPFYQKLEGTQPTTAYIISGSLFFSLDKADSGFSYGIPGSN
ncbi:MAG: hypothetical protein FH748_07890 [Balneolaceae bacterium]|nr:hypothetical protein [Balneolaceae bacterium]